MGHRPAEPIPDIARVTNVDALASDREAVAALLDALPPPCHTALRAFAEAGRPIDAEYVRAELANALGAPTTDGALARLEEVGLLIGGRHPDSHAAQLGLKPALARTLRALFDAWSERSAAVLEPPRPLPFAAVILLAHLANARPRLTTRGNLYARDRDALLERFWGLAAADLTRLYNTLLELCQLHRGEDGRLALDPEQVTNILSASPSALAHLRHLAALERLDSGGRDLLRSLVRWGGAAPRAWALAAARLREAASREGRRFHWGSDIAGLRRLAAATLAKLAAAELVTVRGDEVQLSASLHAALLRAERSEGEAKSSLVAPVPGPGRCVVQPDLTVLVPPDEAPARAFEVGRFSELVRFDTVATFRIDRASVRRGRHEGVTREKMRTVLHDASAHPVSDNVMRAIDDLAGPDRIAHLVEGIVIHLPDLDAEEAARLGLTATPIPGAWVAKPAQRARLLRALSREGIEVETLGRPPAASGSAEAEQLFGDLARCLRASPRGMPPRPLGLSAPPLSTRELTSREPVTLAAPWLEAARRLEVRPELLAVFAEAWRHHPWPRHQRPDPIDVLARLDPADGRRVTSRQVRGTAGLLTAVLRDCHCCGAPALLGERAVDSALTLGCQLLLWPETSPEPLTVRPHRTVERGGSRVLLCEVTTTGESRAFPIPGMIMALGSP